MSESGKIKGSNSLSSPFLLIKESKITHAILITGFVALLIIGALASIGVFNFMSVVNATYLSYGLYICASLFLMCEIIKLSLDCSKKRDLKKSQTEVSLFKKEILEQALNKKDFDVKINKFEISSKCSGGSYSCEHQCKLTLRDGTLIEKKISSLDISVLKNAISRDKIGIFDLNNEGELSTINIHYHFQGSGSDESPDEIINKLQQISVKK